MRRMSACTRTPARWRRVSIKSGGTGKQGWKDMHLIRHTRCSMKPDLYSIHTPTRQPPQRGLARCPPPSSSFQETDSATLFPSNREKLLGPSVYDLRQKAHDLNHYRADRDRKRRRKIALFSIMPSDDLRPLQVQCQWVSRLSPRAPAVKSRLHRLAHQLVELGHFLEALTCRSGCDGARA